MHAFQGLSIIIDQFDRPTQQDNTVLDNCGQTETEQTWKDMVTRQTDTNADTNECVGQYVQVNKCQQERAVNKQNKLQVTI